MKAQVFSYRQAAKLLKDNGYYIDRMHGDHVIWTNGENHITITRKTPNKMVMLRLIKENNLQQKGNNRKD